MSTLDPHASVGGIVLEHSECAKVFSDHRIDFCCRGERSVEVACAEQGLDLARVLADLELAIAGRAGSKESAEADPRAMTTPDLIAYIIARHHAYLYRALPFLEPLAAKVARVHGDRNPKLPALRDTLRELAAALDPHMREEEAVLFPALTAQRRDPKLIAEELASMQREHLSVGALLVCLRTLADDFTAPDWACGSYRTLFSELAVLEMDTLRHVHLETHALMPRFVDGAASAGQAASP